MSNPDRSRAESRPLRRSAQRGVTLVEILVGLVVGLLVIAAAIGTLILSRNVAGSVSDMTQLQQQGAYALRLIGMQLRQAGSMNLEGSPMAEGSFQYASAAPGFGGGTKVVVGTDGDSEAPDTLSFGKLVAATLTETQQRDCLGNGPGSGNRLDGVFYVKDDQLYCKTPANNRNQPLIANVADFQVDYRLGTTSGTRILSAKAVEEGDLWTAVYAVEICLDLQGSENGNPDLGTYRNCQGADVSRNGRLHLVFRNVFNLRTQKGG